MHYSVRADLIEQIAQRMNPEKYTWSDRHKAEVRESAAGLLTFIEGYQRAAELQEKVSKANGGILNNYPAAIVANQTDLQGVPAQTGVGKLTVVPYYPPGVRGGNFSLADPDRPAPTPSQEYRPRPDRPYDTRVNMTTGYSDVGAQRDSSADPMETR